MNIDQQEVQKFADLAEKWWDTSGDFKPLHVINPLRAEYISSKVELEGKTLLDVGCGGGILAEALHDKGAIVTGIDDAQHKRHRKNHEGTKGIGPIDAQRQDQVWPFDGSFHGCVSFRDANLNLSRNFHNSEYD